MRKFRFRLLPFIMLIVIVFVNVIYANDAGNSSNRNIMAEVTTDKTQSTNVNNDETEKSTAPALDIKSKAALLMEPTTGKIILEKNSHEELPLASVTKVMTILLIYEAVEEGKINWDDVVTISDHAAGMGGSQIFLEPGEKQTVRDLTKAIVIASANDGAVAMGEFIAGSESAFVTAMNRRATELGMNNTNFKNACGLDEDDHYSSAYDIALMSKELITKHPEVLEFSKTWMDTITHHTARGDSEFGLTNTNRLINSYTGATGLKTGSTSKALYCISATATRDNMDLIAVVLAAPDPNTRFLQAMQLLDFGFANYMLLKGQPEGTKVGEIGILKGNVETVPVVVKNEISAIVPKGKNTTIDFKVEMLEGLNAPTPAGTKAGEIVYYCEDKEVGRCDVVTYEKVDKATLNTSINRLIQKWFAPVSK